MKLENYIIPIGVIVISAFMLQHAHYSTKLETVEKAFRMCESVITPAQRKELLDEWEYQNEIAEEMARDRDNQDRY